MCPVNHFHVAPVNWLTSAFPTKTFYRTLIPDKMTYQQNIVNFLKVQNCFWNWKLSLLLLYFVWIHVCRLFLGNEDIKRALCFVLVMHTVEFTLLDTGFWQSMSYINQFCFKIYIIIDSNHLLPCVSLFVEAGCLHCLLKFCMDWLWVCAYLLLHDHV